MLIAITHVRSEWRYVHGDLASGRARVLERAPERPVVAEAQQRVDEVRVEPAAAAADRDAAGGVRPACGVEDLHGLREAEDPAEQRDLIAREPLRLPMAVPVLVERPDRLRRALAEAEQPGDVRAALAARAHQRAGDLPLLPQRQQLVHLRAHAAVRHHGADRPGERADGARPVDALGRPLGLAVVGGEQRRHPR
jgi:hypothetical protein